MNISSLNSNSANSKNQNVNKNLNTQKQNVSFKSSYISAEMINDISRITVKQAKKKGYGVEAEALAKKVIANVITVADYFKGSNKVDVGFFAIKNKAKKDGGLLGLRVSLMDDATKEIKVGHIPFEHVDEQYIGQKISEIANNFSGTNNKFNFQTKDLHSENFEDLKEASKKLSAKAIELKEHRTQNGIKEGVTLTEALCEKFPALKPVCVFLDKATSFLD